MFKTGIQSRVRCPNCGSACYFNNDLYENYYTCISCAKEFDMDMKPRRLTAEGLKRKTGIGLTSQELRASIRDERRMNAEREMPDYKKDIRLPELYRY